jgi:hypothetical protein
VVRATVVADGRGAADGLAVVVVGAGGIVVGEGSATDTVGSVGLVDVGVVLGATRPMRISVPRTVAVP